MRLCEAAFILMVGVLPFSVIGETVVVLTDNNFSNEVLQSSKLWMVKFYAPWCGHCKHLAPTYDKASVEVGRLGLMKMGKVDATVENTRPGFLLQ